MKKNINKKGFTLIEILVVIAILGFLAWAVSSFQIDIFKNNAAIGQSLSADLAIRQMLKRITSELRAAGPGSTGAYPIGQASSSTLVFYTNTDSDALIERVRYFVDRSDLKRGVLKPSGSPLSYGGTETVDTIVSNLVATSSGIFYYYDSGYAGTTTYLGQPLDPVVVRLVKISISVDEDINRAPLPIFGETQVSIRNLKDQ